MTNPAEQNQREIELGKKVLPAPIFPAFGALMVASIPNWNTFYFLIAFTLVIACALWGWISYSNKSIAKPSWKPLFLLVNMNIFALCFLFTAWRILGESIIFGLILFVITVLAFLFAHRYRFELFTGLYAPKKQPVFARIYYTLFFLPLIGGPVSYGYARWIESTQGTDTALIVIGVVMIPFGFAFLFIFHPFYARVERPDWMPNKKNADASF